MSTPDTTSAETVVDESESLADHEAQFGSPAARAAAAAVEDTPAEPAEPLVAPEPPKQAEKRRAPRSVATPEDVGRIAELTRKLRETERERDELKTLHAPVAGPATITISPPIIASTNGKTPTDEFTEKEPTQEDFALEDNPFAAWTRAVASYDRRKERFEEKQAEQQTAMEKAEQDSRARDEAVVYAHNARVNAFVQKKPDFQQVISAKEVEDLGALPPLLVRVIAEDDNGPELMYYLASNPDELAEFILLADGKAVNEQSAALLRRRLHTRGLTATTGTVPTAPPLRTVPRPPIPVRPGPTSTAPVSEVPDDNDESLSSHEKAFGPKSRFGARRR